MSAWRAEGEFVIHGSGFSLRSRTPEEAKVFAAAFDLADALEALTDPEGHIFHGGSGLACTGECRAVRAALRAAGRLP